MSGPHPQCRVLLASASPYSPVVCDSCSDLFLKTWTALRNAGQVFGRLSLRLGLSGVFLMFDWGYQPYGHNITEVPISSPNTGGYMKSQDITGDINFDHLS